MYIDFNLADPVLGNYPKKIDNWTVTQQMLETTDQKIKLLYNENYAATKNYVAAY